MQRSGKLVRSGTSTKKKIRKICVVTFFPLDVEIPGSPGKEGGGKKRRETKGLINICQV